MANSFRKKRPPKAAGTDIKIMTKEEQRKFTEVLPFFSAGNIFAVALATGMRIGELCALDVRDIDREQKTIHVTKSVSQRQYDYTIGKTGVIVNVLKPSYAREIPLLPSVEQMIDRQLELNEKTKQRSGAAWNENALLFPTERGNIHDKDGLRASMDRIAKRAGLGHITVNTLRHTYAMTVLNAGVAAENVARLLGEKDGAATLKCYARYINSEVLARIMPMENRNTGHLGITSEELHSVLMNAESAIEKTYAGVETDRAAAKPKKPSKESVMQVLSVCEDMLIQTMDNRTQREKDILLCTMAQYTLMKRQYEEQERPAKEKNTKSQGR